MASVVQGWKMIHRQTNLAQKGFSVLIGHEARKRLFRNENAGLLSEEAQLPLVEQIHASSDRIKEETKARLPNQNVTERLVRYVAVISTTSSFHTTNICIVI